MASTDDDGTMERHQRTTLQFRNTLATSSLNRENLGGAESPEVAPEPEIVVPGKLSAGSAANDALLKPTNRKITAKNMRTTQLRETKPLVLADCVQAQLFCPVYFIMALVLT